MDNPSDVQHNIALEGGGIDEKGAGKGRHLNGQGQRRRASATFLWCTVPGHAAAA